MVNFMSFLIIVYIFSDLKLGIEDTVTETGFTLRSKKTNEIYEPKVLKTLDTRKQR